MYVGTAKRKPVLIGRAKPIPKWHPGNCANIKHVGIGPYRGQTCLNNRRSTVGNNIDCSIQGFLLLRFDHLVCMYLHTVYVLDFVL